MQQSTNLEIGKKLEGSEASVSKFLNSQFDALEAKQALSQSQDSLIAALPPSPMRLSDACKVVVNATQPPLMSLARIAAASHLGIGCDVSCVLPLKKTTLEDGSMMSVSGQDTSEEVDLDVKLAKIYLGSPKTDADLSKKDKSMVIAPFFDVDRFCVDKCVDLQAKAVTAVRASEEVPRTAVLPCSQAQCSTVTLAPDHSPKIPSLQGAVGACSSTEGITADSANKSAKLKCVAPIPTSFSLSPEIPMDLSPLDTVGACSSVERLEADNANTSPPTPSDMSISPETSHGHPPQGVVGASSNAGCPIAATTTSSSCSSDESPARRLFPVFSRSMSQDTKGSKKLSRKLKSSRRVSRVGASEEKQTLMLHFYKKELSKEGDVDRL